MTMHVTDQTFDQDVLNNAEPVLVDFWAPWCGPCKALAPMFESLAAEYTDKVKFAKVDIDATEIAQNYGVRGVPTLMLFKQGQPVATLVGNQPKAKIVELLAAHA